jgi:chemotaxis protein CheC
MPGMTTETVDNFDDHLLTALHEIVSEGMHNAVHGFAGLLGQSLVVSKPSVKLVPLYEIPSINGGPETEAIGIYLRVEGDISGQMMMIVPYNKALELVDLLLDEPPGTTTRLDSFERSALAEVGNQTGTFFLNAVARMIGGSLRPSPPAVMVDMIGSILDIVVATTGQISDQVMLIQADMMNGDRSVETSFWVIPDMNTVQRIASRGHST